MEIPKVQRVALALEADTRSSLKRRSSPSTGLRPRQRHCQSPSGAPATSLRRNERERNRVRLVNLGFASLRQHIPQWGLAKRMSKVDTLRSAVEYIRMLEVLLQEQNYGDSQMSPSSATGRGSIADSPLSSYSSEDISHDSVCSEQEFMTCKDWLRIE